MRRQVLRRRGCDAQSLLRARRMESIKCGETGRGGRSPQRCLLLLSMQLLLRRRVSSTCEQLIVQWRRDMLLQESSVSGVGR